MPQNTTFGTQARRALADYPPGQRLAYAVNRDGAILGRAASGDHAGLKALRDCEIARSLDRCRRRTERRDWSHLPALRYRNRCRQGLILTGPTPTPKTAICPLCRLMLAPVWRVVSFQDTAGHWFSFEICLRCTVRLERLPIRLQLRQLDAAVGNLWRHPERYDLNSPQNARI